MKTLLLSLLLFLSMATLCVAMDEPAIREAVGREGDFSKIFSAVSVMLGMPHTHDEVVREANENFNKCKALLSKLRSLAVTDEQKKMIADLAPMENEGDYTLPEYPMTNYGGLVPSESPAWKRYDASATIIEGLIENNQHIITR